MKPRIIDRIAATSTATAIALGLALSAPAFAADMDMTPKVLPADEITFQPGPGTLPKGVEFAVLQGNPAEEGAFVLRLKFPAGYTIPPHMHPEEEHVTVISGLFAVGAGETLDEAAMARLVPGSFVRIPTGLPHFARAMEPTVVQINAMGPFGITYVNEGDDPRIN